LIHLSYCLSLKSFQASIVSVGFVETTLAGCKTGSEVYLVVSTSWHRDIQVNVHINNGMSLVGGKEMQRKMTLPKTLLHKVRFMFIAVVVPTNFSWYAHPAPLLSKIQPTNDTTLFWAVQELALAAARTSLNMAVLASIFAPCV
jgi:hypothetical protein